jgi:DNA-binding response OmpR family regulator
MSVRITLPMARRHQAEINGRVIRLPTQTYQLLELIVLRGDLFSSYDELVEMLWPDPDLQPLTARDIVQTYICRLRKLGVRFSVFHGLGYRLERRLSRQEIGPAGSRHPEMRAAA